MYALLRCLVGIGSILSGQAGNVSRDVSHQQFFLPRHLDVTEDHVYNALRVESQDGVFFRKTRSERFTSPSEG